MDFKRLVSLEMLAAIIGAASVTLLVDYLKINPYWLVLFIPSLLLAIHYTTISHRLQVFRSGVISYYTTFPIQQGPAYWHDSKHEFAYWGVTGASIQEELHTLLVQDRGEVRVYRFLLMSPEGNAMKEQLAFKSGVNLHNASPDQIQRIEHERDVARRRLDATIAVLKNSPAFAAGRLEIRLFDEFLPWWAYVLDNRRMIIGLLRYGQEVGEGPAAVVEKNPQDHNLFDAFHQNFERVWRSSRTV